jgi:hypothetical protein
MGANMANQIEKEQIRDWLRFNGFKEYGQKDVWSKSTPRMSVTITLKKNEVEEFVREHPLKEGWWTNHYPYSSDVTKKIQLPRY